MKNEEYYIRYKKLIGYLNAEIHSEEKKNSEEIDTIYVYECRKLIFEIEKKCKRSENVLKKRYSYYVMIIELLYSKNHT